MRPLASKGMLVQPPRAIWKSPCWRVPENTLLSSARSVTVMPRFSLSWLWMASMSFFHLSEVL